MARREDIGAWLSARYYLYALFQSLFGTEPNGEQVTALNPSLVAEALELVGIDPHDFIEDLQRYGGKIDTMAGEYNRLFIGPAELPAPPWESVFAAHSDVLFGRKTLEVRSAYRLNGYLPECYPAVADDHVALELGFMAVLAQRALAAWEEVDDEGALALVATSERFLEEHLGWWAPLWVARLAKADSASCYTCFAKTMALFVKRDADALKLMPVSDEDS